MHHGGGGAGHGHGGNHGGSHGGNHGNHGNLGGHGAHHNSHHQGGAPSSSVSWNMAMQADSFWVNALKANSKPLLIVVGVIGAMFGWLCLLYFLHHKDSPQHVVTSNEWNQQLTAVNPREAPMQSFSQPAEAQGVSVSSAPEAFGAPRSADEDQSADAAPTNNRTYSNRTTPSLAPLMFSHMMPGYQPQPSGPSFSAATFASPAPNAAPGLAMPQQLFPTRVHSTERFKVVVSR